MAFDLPRSPRSLRFTGEVRSLAAKEETAPPSRGLAKPRPPLPSNGIDTPTRMRTVRGDGVRRPMPSIGGDDDNLDTLCMDRDALDIALLPDARLGKPQLIVHTPGPHLPVPGFRSLDDVVRQQHAALNAPRATRPSGPFALGVWLIASLAVAVVSFFVAPLARDHLVRNQPEEAPTSDDR